MPSGRCNNSETLSHTKDVIHSSVKCQLALVYLENIVVLSKTPGQHGEDVRKISFFWNNADAALKLNNLSFFQALTAT